MDDLKLAERYEAAATFYAPYLFNEYGVPAGYRENPDSHREEVAYVANCFVIASALRARATLSDNGGV